MIYYASTFPRALYTFRTGQVIGRVASTVWYHETYGGNSGVYMQPLGEIRCGTRPRTISSLSGHLRHLWPVFAHYGREVLQYAGSGPPALNTRPWHCECVAGLIAAADAELQRFAKMRPCTGLGS